MSNIINFKKGTSPNDVLENSIDTYDSVLVIGWDKEDYFDARSSDNLTKKSDVLYLIETFRFKLMRGDYDE